MPFHSPHRRRCREAFSIATTRSYGRPGRFRALLFLCARLPTTVSYTIVGAGHAGDPSLVSSSSSSAAHSPRRGPEQCLDLFHGPRVGVAPGAVERGVFTEYAVLWNHEFATRSETGCVIPGPNLV
jgi:hypothetical protein